MKSFVFYFIFLSFFISGILFANDEDTPEQIQNEIEHDRRLLIKSPDNAIILNRLGFNLYRQGKDDEAFNLFNRTIKLNPNLSTPYNNLGVIFLKRRDYIKAEYNFNISAQLDSNSAKPLYNLAVTYFRQKKYWQAAKTYLKSKNTDGSYVKQRYNKTKAKNEINNLLKEDPDNEYLLKISKELDKNEP
ncbi:MAG: tetratricopeptide repeat protein [Candidatus Firestonebacteria bacterium]|nr:tetratricopeptide repeat protein [Candidatus Firestonebacteria bacterium]